MNISVLSLFRSIFIMFKPKQFLKLLLLAILMQIFYCLTIIPERAEILFANDTLVENVTFNVRRYSRKGDYVVNLMFYSKMTFNNDVKVDFIFYQYLHNEYRRSFVEMRYYLCDLVNEDLIIGPTLRKNGLSCPIPPGRVAFTNLTFNQPKSFKFVWPFEKGLAEVIVSSPKALIGKGRVMMSFKQDVPKKQN